MPYRGRAVKRVKGQRKLKPLNPTVKFTLTKTYQVQRATNQPTGSNAHILQINAATPFSPLSTISGQWTATNTASEPVGLASDLYTHYKYLVVKGCHVGVSVVDDVDTSGGEDETISLGQLSVVRASISGIVQPTIDGPALKVLYGQKSRDFTLSTDNIAKRALMKSAYCSNGYSAKKTWNTQANANDNLRVENLSGSQNAPNDSTFINIVVCPRYATPGFLQPVIATVRISYIVQFQEPTIVQTVPLPMYSAGEKEFLQQRKTQTRAKNYRTVTNQMKLASIAAAAAMMMRPKFSRDRYLL